MQQSTPPGTPAAAWITAYGAFALSVLALLIIGAAWLLRVVDQATALAVIGAILAGNGLVTATQWQAAPGLVGDLQAIIGQLASHIQTLHAQAVSQQVTQLATSRMPAIQAPAPSSAPASTPAAVPQQQFAPSTSFAQASWPLPIPPASRSSAGG